MLSIAFVALVLAAAIGPAFIAGRRNVLRSTVKKVR